MRSSSLFTFTLLLFIPTAVLSPEIRRDPRGEYTINQLSRYTSLELTKKHEIYYTGEKIPLEVTITNTGYQVSRIYPDTRSNLSFRFMVLDPQGREIQPRLSPLVSRHNQDLKAVVNSNGDYNKEILLHPGESFSREIDLNQFYQLQSETKYRVHCYFWPDFRHQNYFIRSTNMVRLQVRNHSKRNQIRTDHRFRPEHNAPLISPSETVYLFLSAEMRSNWTNYFKFLDLDRYITSYDRFAARFANADQAGRQQILAEFQDYLISLPADRLREFKIIATDKQRSVDEQSSPLTRYTVKVAALRSDNGYSARYEYNYTLERISKSSAAYWKIIHVEAILKSSGE